MSKSIRAYCSWCFKKTTHKLVTHKALARNTYQCQGCGSLTVQCRLCQNMARTGERWGDSWCGEHNGTVANFKTLSKRLKDITGFRKITKPVSTNMIRVGKRTAFVAGGVLATGTLTFLAAPAISGVLGAWTGLSGAAATGHGLALLGGGSLAAGGLGMAGGVAVVTAAGAALGGTLGGVTLGPYAREVTGFDIVRVRNGEEPRVVLVNGFLSQDKDDVTEWMPAVNKKYPKSAVYHIRWESKRLGDLGQTVGSLLAKKALFKALKQVAKKASKKTLKLGPLGTVISMFDLAGNDWHVALHNAYKAGSAVADIIARTDGQKFVLMGHSLGARVLAYALEALGTKPKKRIRTVHLLGGGVGAQDKEGWSLRAKAVTGRIYNYYSTNDLVLKYVYRPAMFFQSKPIGRTPIPCQSKKIQNIDVTEYISGHMDFKANFDRFIRGGRA